jgi:type VI secretion system Hcp family effector
VATGRVTGKAQHGAITFVKEWGSATPQILQALATSEVLSKVTIEFMTTTASGKQQVLMRVQLKNARIVSVEDKAGATLSSSERKEKLGVLSYVSIAYESITVTHPSSATEASVSTRR